MTDGQIKRIELSIILAFIGLYVWLITHYFWAYPMVGDPHQWIAPLVTKSIYQNVKPYLLGIMPTICIGMFSSYIQELHIATSTYVLFAHAAILSAGALWVRKNTGFVAAVAFCIFFSYSDLLLPDSTYLHDTETELLFMMLAFVTFFRHGEFETLKKYPFVPTLLRSRFFYTGAFCACAVFSKPTAIAAIWLFSLLIFLNKSWDRGRVFLECVYGGLIGSLIVLVLFVDFVSAEALWRAIRFFFTGEILGYIDTAQGGAYQFPGYYAWALGGIGASVILATKAYPNLKARASLLFASFYMLVYYLIWFVSKAAANYRHDQNAFYTFAALGLSIMLGDIFNHAKTIRFKRLEKIPGVLQSFLAALLLFLTCYGGWEIFFFVARYSDWIFAQIILLIDGASLFPYAHVLRPLYILPIVLLGFSVAMRLTALLDRLKRSQFAWFEEVKTPPLLHVFLGVSWLILAAYGTSLGVGLIADNLDRTFWIKNDVVPFLPLLLTLVVFLQFFSSRLLVVLFLTCFMFLVPPYSIRVSHTDFFHIKRQSDFMYGEFPFALKQVHSDAYSFYVKKWLMTEHSTVELNYAMTTYRLFFDKSYDETRHVSLSPGSTICQLSAEDSLPSMCGSYILTDDVDAVRRYYSEYRLIKAFVSPSLITYYILEVIRR